MPLSSPNVTLAVLTVVGALVATALLTSCGGGQRPAAPPAPGVGVPPPTAPGPVPAPAPAPTDPLAPSDAPAVAPPGAPPTRAGFDAQADALCRRLALDVRALTPPPAGLPAVAARTVRRGLLAFTSTGAAFAELTTPSVRRAFKRRFTVALRQERDHLGRLTATRDRRSLRFGLVAVRRGVRHQGELARRNGLTGCGAELEGAAAAISPRRPARHRRPGAPRRRRAG